MSERRFERLINDAASLLRRRRIGGRLFGDVASVLITREGEQFGGVCIDTGAGTGFCAEHAAIAAMVTAGEYTISTIVAVWRDEEGRLFVLPPCGRCREFIRQIDVDNINALVVLSWDRALPLSELLPEWQWPAPLDREPGASTD